jgi:cholinesterase
MAPEPPLNNRSAGVQNGTYGNICPQAYGSWQLGAKVLNPPASVENEDCLFLDVVVSPKTFNSSKSDAPVIIWLHGGGYAIGSKISSGVTTNPTGLLDRSFEDDGEGTIFVAMNYRVCLRTHSSHLNIMLIILAWSLWFPPGSNIPKRWYTQRRTS